MRLPSPLPWSVVLAMVLHVKLKLSLPVPSLHCLVPENIHTSPTDGFITTLKPPTLPEI